MRTREEHLARRHAAEPGVSRVHAVGVEPGLDQAAAGTLIKIDCEDEEDDDYWSSQSARRGRHDSSDDEQAKFEKEQHDRAVGLQMQQEILDDCAGEGNWE